MYTTWQHTYKLAPLYHRISIYLHEHESYAMLYKLGNLEFLERSSFMIVVQNRIHVKPEHAEDLENRFRNRSGLIDQMDGFISNQVLRPTQEGEPYVIQTYWESREKFEAWTQSESFQKAHAKPMSKESHTAPNHVEIYEVIMDTSQIDN